MWPIPPPSAEQSVPLDDQPTPLAITEQVVELAPEECKGALVVDQELELEQNYESLVESEPTNNPPAAVILSCDLRVVTSITPGIPRLMEAMV